MWYLQTHVTHKNIKISISFYGRLSRVQGRYDTSSSDPVRLKSMVQCLFLLCELRIQLHINNPKFLRDLNALSYALHDKFKNK